jgi:hypothetical protein
MNSPSLLCLMAALPHHTFALNSRRARRATPAARMIHCARHLCLRVRASH